eukprot:m.17861 g.17861  ORF g.17861 m.17861 type:complete len:439 (+) comp6133_c0_seq1:259-1575(+)
MKAPRILIVGAGIGGLSMGVALRRSVPNATIHVIERRTQEAWLKSLRNNVGLWSPALACLKKFDVLDKLKKEFVTKSSYKNTAGDTLARPSFTLDSRSPENPSLAFVSESDLSNILAKDFLNSNQRDQEDMVIKFGSEFQSLSSSIDNGLSDYNLIVAADGSYSKVFSTIHHQVQQQLSPKDKLADKNISMGHVDTYGLIKSIISPPPKNIWGLQPQGYTVFRGTSAYHIEESFQTWGPSARFAVVPCPGGCAWFAAITNESSQDDTADEPQYVYKKRKEITAFFENWHSPIPDIINAEESDDSMVPGIKAIATKDIAESKPNEIKLGNKSIPVVFVGDAFHTLDPILAQGAGVAIEDAVNFTHLYSKTEDVQSSISEFYEQKQSRLMRLQFLQTQAQFMGHREHPSICKMRDTMLLNLPQNLKSFLFDFAIRYSVKP